LNIQLLKAGTPEKIVQEGFTVLQKREKIAVYDKSQQNGEVGTLVRAAQATWTKHEKSVN
jgi:hypothetical protein